MENKIIIFTLEERKYALHLNNVLKVIQSVDITPLPEISDIILGVIDYHSEILPVVNLRKKLSFQDKQVDLNDLFILLQTKNLKTVLIADSIYGIIDYDEDLLKAIDENILKPEYLKGTLTIENEIVLIYDLEKFLNLEEEQRIKNALLNLNN